MSAAPLRSIVEAEAVGAIAVGGLLLVWTGAAAESLRLPATPASWAVVRIAAVTILCFGALLWSVREHAVRSPATLSVLAGAHAVAAMVLLLLQQFAIWTNSFGALLAFVPLGLAFRYWQYARRAVASDQNVSTVVRA